MTLRRLEEGGGVEGKAKEPRVAEARGRSRGGTGRGRKDKNKKNPSTGRAELEGRVERGRSEIFPEDAMVLGKFKRNASVE